MKNRHFTGYWQILKKNGFSFFPGVQSGTGKCVKARLAIILSTIFVIKINLFLS